MSLHPFSRRALLARLLAAGPVALVVAACTGRRPAAPGGASDAAGPTLDTYADGGSTAGGVPAADAPAATDAAAEPPAAAALPPTPACGDDDDPTPPQTEGPYFKADSPERRDLTEPGMAGTALVVTGRVLDTACRPVAAALIDVWHCDDEGVYDNDGYRLRGHQFSAADGSYRLTTILPGTYPGRTRHIHVRVQAPNGPLLTTQLYFPGERDNARDGIYDAALEVTLADDAPDGGRRAAFDFVLET